MSTDEPLTDADVYDAEAPPPADLLDPCGAVADALAAELLREEGDRG